MQIMSVYVDGRKIYIVDANSPKIIQERIVLFHYLYYVAVNFFHIWIQCSQHMNILLHEINTPYGCGSQR